MPPPAPAIAVPPRSAYCIAACRSKAAMPPATLAAAVSSARCCRRFHWPRQLCLLARRPDALEGAAVTPRSPQRRNLPPLLAESPALLFDISIFGALAAGRRKAVARGRPLLRCPSTPPQHQDSDASRRLDWSARLAL